MNVCIFEVVSAVHREIPVDPKVCADLVEFSRWFKPRNNIIFEYIEMRVTPMCLVKNQPLPGPDKDYPLVKEFRYNGVGVGCPFDTFEIGTFL